MKLSARSFGMRGYGMAARQEILRRAARLAALVMLIPLIAVLPALASQAAGAAPGTRAAGATAGQLPVLDVVMLVDESGSETDAKVADEKATALTIVQSMLNPSSRVTVVGFGGVNNVVPGQNPVDVVCQPTIASPGNAGYLTSCVNKLHRRADSEGNDTDYAAALGQAMGYFNQATSFGQQSPANATKVILMMTDGAVDVHNNTKQYGANWMEGEQQAIDLQLGAAKQDRVQIWPLGFGTDIGTVDGTNITEAQALTNLNQIAAGGAPSVCNGQSTVPRATWVNNPDQAVNAVDTLYAHAACAAVDTPPGGPIGGGITSRTLTVQIPEIASDAVITVDRGNPDVQVTFTEPDGQQWTDSSAISGQDNSPVEALHVANITSGEVGTWKIELTAPANLAKELVSATALWQGAVRTVITTSPPSAKLGQSVCVQMSVLGTNGPVSDLSTLSSLIVGLTASGDGLPANDRVPISANSRPGCAVTGPGTYAGTFTAPSQQGNVTLTGNAVGYGLYTTQVPTTVAVGTASTGFTATITLPVVAKVQAGNGIIGQLNIANQTGAERKVLLEITSSGAHPSIGGASNPVTAPSGPPSNSDFTVAFPGNSPTDVTWFQVTAVDAANPALVYDRESLEVTVTKQPGWLGQHLWELVGGIIALILLVLFIIWRRRLRRWRMDTRGLVAIVHRDGQQVHELKASNRWADSFRFAVKEENGQLLLDHPQPGLSLYSAKRSGNRVVTVTTPAGAEYEGIVIGGQAKPIEGAGFGLAFADRSRPAPWWTFGAARGPRRPRRARHPRGERQVPVAKPVQSQPTSPEANNSRPASAPAPEKKSELW